MSTLRIEAKYIALGHAAQEAISPRRFLHKLQVLTQPINNMTLYDNNEINIILTKNVKSQQRIKQNDVQCHYIQELDDEKELEVKCICSTNILADRFTKVLSTNIFRRHQATLEIVL